MREFLKQCMKDLYAITGIEQVKWMQNDMKNGERDFNTCLDAMVTACGQFPYITDENKQKVIRRMMQEDRAYKSLNARVVWGWLDMHKDAYYRGQTHHDEEPQHEPAPPEVAEIYIEQFKKNLESVGKPIPYIPKEEIQELGRLRDPIVNELKKQYKVDRPSIIATPEDHIRRERHDEWIRENFDKLTGKKLDCWTPENEWLELKYPTV